MVMRMKPRALILPMVLAVPLALACNNPSGSGAASDVPTSSATTPSIATMLPPAASAAQTASAAEAPRPMMKPHQGGPVATLLAAAHDQSLKDDQKAALAKIDESLKPDQSGPPKEMKDARDTVVAGVRAGKLDTARIDAMHAAAAKAMQARQDRDADALTSLYKTLDAGQRKSVVAAARARDAARDERMMKHKAEGVADKDGDRAKRKLERMTKELELDAAQQKTVEGLLAKNDPKPDMDAMHAEWKKKTEALYTAFESDSFDAKKLDLSMGGKRMREGMQQHVQLLGQLLPILRPEQREKLAVSMEKAHRGHEGHEGHPKGLFEERSGGEQDLLEMGVGWSQPIPQFS